MVRVVVRGTVCLLLAVVLAFPLDWLVWRLRVAAGGGMDRVSVRRVTVAALKGNRSEFYVDGTTEVDCSRSFFPQAGAGACWWLRRQGEITTQD